MAKNSGDQTSIARLDPGESIGMAQAWERMREILTPEELGRVADLIVDYDASTMTGLNAILAALVRETIRGHVPPIVITTIQPILQMLAHNVHVMHAAMRSPEEVVRRDVVVMASEVVRNARPLQPVYQRAALPDSQPSAIPGVHEVVGVGDKDVIES